MEQSVAENSECEGAGSVDEAAEEPVESKEARSEKNGLENAIQSELNREEYKSKNSKEQTEAERSVHGSLAFIYYTDPETGITEYLIEENKPDYPGGQGGKYRLIGGAREAGESSLKTLERELEEEFKSRDASSILIKILKKNQHKYGSIQDLIYGKISITHVYDINVESKTEWNKIRRSGSKHDAGTFRAIKDIKILELLHKNKLYFAFGPEHAEIIKEFIWDNYLTRLNQNHYNKVCATAYSDKIAA